MSLRVGVLGAGSIGCYVGAHLIRAGISTTLIGRQRLLDEVASHGIRISDTDGADFRLLPADVDVATDPARLADCGLILVCVKSADTDDAAALIAALPVSAGRVVVSFQNGVRNADQLRAGVRHAQVLAGMVPWNVVWKRDAHFHRGSGGELMIESAGGGGRAAADLLNRAGLRTLLHDNLRAVLWGKLLLNLNNPVNALSGLPLREQLAVRGYRRIVAALMREALSILHAAGIAPAKAARLPPALVPFVLELPDWLFMRIASSMLRIDPLARSSMWEDLQRGRATEIDYINGEIVRLAESLGRQAPLNSAIVGLVHQAERAQSVAAMTAAALATALRLPIDQ